MKVRELIEKLKGFDQEMEVWLCDNIEGNDCEMGDSSSHTCEVAIEDVGHHPPYHKGVMVGRFKRREG
jgi:hypothetical protein